jgi:hypothetical protein
MWHHPNCLLTDLLFPFWLQGVNNTGQSGPSLSLSSMGGQGHQPGTNGQRMPGQCYNGMDVCGSWLRTIPSRGSDLVQVLGRPGGLNLQHLLSTDSKTHQSPQSATSATANSNSQVFRTGLHSQVLFWCNALCYVHTAIISLCNKFEPLHSFVYSVHKHLS